MSPRPSNLPSPFKICGEKRLSEHLRDLDARLQACIDDQSDDSIASVDEKAFSERLIEEFSLTVPYLDCDHPEVSTGKKLVPAEQFPPSQFHVQKGRSYQKDVVIYHIPCEGDATLLGYRVDGVTHQYYPTGFIADNHLCFEIIDFYDDLERVKKSGTAVIGNIKTLSPQVIQEIESYNYSLQWNIVHRIQERKKNIDRIAKVLGVPIRKSEALRTDVQNSARLKPHKDGDTDTHETYDVFLSYASGDSREALKIYEAVVAAGGRVFLSEKSLKAGDDFAERIRSALHASDELWLLLSPNSLRSEWVISEWGAAWVLRKRIIPILFRCTPQDAPDRIGRLHCIDYHRCTELVHDRFPESRSNR
jgi:hypothetical protein